MPMALETLGAVLAQGLVEAAERPVGFVNVSRSVRAARNLSLATRALILKPHIAVILIGGNDVTHLTRPQTAVRDLGQAVARLVDSGSEVVVGTCPDLRIR